MRAYEDGNIDDWWSNQMICKDVAGPTTMTTLAIFIQAHEEIIEGHIDFNYMATWQTNNHIVIYFQWSDESNHFKSAVRFPFEQIFIYFLCANGLDK